MLFVVSFLLSTYLTTYVLFYVLISFVSILSMNMPDCDSRIFAVIRIRICIGRDTIVASVGNMWYKHKIHEAPLMKRIVKIEYDHG